MDIALLLFRRGVRSQRHRRWLARMLRDSRSQKETLWRQSHEQIAACYHAFVREFERIKFFSASHHDTMAWIGGQFSDHRKAWQSGIRTLRNISGGRLPQDVGEVMAFLCVCKSASETLDFFTASEYTSRFFADLRRWSILFDNPSNFDVYKDAVRRIWGHDLLATFDETSSYVLDESLLQYAQGLVSSLVGATSIVIGLTLGGRADGLTQSQQRWRERHASPPPPPPNEDPESANPKPPDILPEEKSPLQREIRNNDSSTHISAKLVLLMAGAIFAILLIFLCCK